MKQRILRRIWNYLTSLEADEAFYRGEHGPYCGLAYSGCDGKYIKAYFHEGDGGGETTFSILGFKLYYECLDQEAYYIKRAPKNHRS